MCAFDSSHKLTPCQATALDVLQRQGNVFLTGAAGTGKSFLLDRYLADKHTDEFPVVASTGAAAVLVGGRTFHSFFGLGILEGGPDATVAKALRNRKLLNRLHRAHCVFIDEISMLSGLTLAVAERIARRVRGRDEPWGGLRIVAVGDFAQLPPVTPNMQGKDWAFLHPVWQESDFTPALLSTVMRTQDTEFLEILNFIREGIVNERVHAFLNNHVETETDGVEGTRLYPHRAQADAYNLRRLEEIPAPVHAIPTVYSGAERFVESGKRVVPIPETLLLKEGALIMMRKNDVSGSMRWVNGSLGHVRHVSDDVLHVTLLSGEAIRVAKEKFTCLDGDGNETMAAWNFPVTLAWASTIHKAQGASLDRMIVDIHQLWEPGQAYVALSRVRSGAGLRIERWNPSSIRADAMVTAFYDLLADKARKYTPRPYFETPKREPEADAFDEEEPRAKTPSRMHSIEDRLRKTREYLVDEMPLIDIAEACDVTETTVIRYIEKLIEQHNAPSLRYLIDEVPDVERVCAAFRKHGLGKMKPVFTALEETISYDELKLVRLVLMAEESF